MTVELQLSEEARKINPLPLEVRERALSVARERSAGAHPSAVRTPEPLLEHYLRNAVSKYPPEHIRRMRQLGYIILVAAWLGSAIRIFMAAFETNAKAFTPEGAQGTAVVVAFVVSLAIALASVLLAESGQVAFTLWGSTLDDDQSLLRGALTVGAIGCTLFALGANAYVMKPWEQANQHVVILLIAWIETLLPPLLVLIASYVLKTQSLHEINTRHEARIQFDTAHATWTSDYDAALARWVDACVNAHLGERWTHYAANALREALRRENRGKSKVVRELTDTDWRVLVLREMATEEWYVRAEQQAVITQPVNAEPEPAATQPVARPVRVQRHVGKTHGRHTGEFDNAVTLNTDGTHTGTCPHCGTEQFVKKTFKGAKAALIAHKRSCVALRETLPAPDIKYDAARAAEAVIEGVDGERQPAPE